MSLIAALPLVGKLLDRLIPDKGERAKAQEALEAAEQSGELQLLLGQMEINRVEAAHSSIFVSGARPFIMWVCGVALAYSFVIYPILKFVVVLTVDDPPVLPVVGIAELMPVLMGILGLGGMRSWEKGKGVARNSL